jgi:hypothetical protein
MSLEAVRQNLIAMRAQLDATLRTVEDALDAPRAPAPEADPGPCRHPDEDRLEAGSLNKPLRFKCRRCGSLVDDNNDGG